MKVRARSYVVMVMVAVLETTSLLTPYSVQGGEAQATAVAELVSPAALDLSKILAVSASRPTTRESACQVKPEVKVMTVDGKTIITIDYN